MAGGRFSAEGFTVAVVDCKILYTLITHGFLSNFMSLESISHWTLHKSPLHFKKINFLGNQSLKIFAGVLFLIILYSLGSALFYMYKDKGNSTRMVRSLSIRIILSFLLFIIMMVYTRLNMDMDIE